MDVLIRVALAVKDNSLQAHLARRLSALDVRTETLGGQRTAWQKVMRCACDVIVVSEGLIPGSAADGISMLNELPENPTTIVIQESDAAEAHAKLTAAGADVVLFGGISRKSMYEAIETALRAHQWNKTQTAKALGIDRRTLFEKIRKLGLGEKGRSRRTG